VLNSVVFFHILTDKAGTLVNSYILMGYKKEVFKDTLNYIPNGVMLLDVKRKSVSFQNKAMKGLFNLTSGWFIATLILT
jgi:hypothetical protein